jgi:hypothetical protein
MNKKSVCKISLYCAPAVQEANVLASYNAANYKQPTTDLHFQGPLKHKFGASFYLLWIMCA